MEFICCNFVGIFFFEKEEFKRIKGWIIVEYSIKDRFSGEDGFMESLFNLLHKFWKLIFEFLSYHG